MESLNLYPSSRINELAWPNETHDLTIESEALLFFTDFMESKPLVIESKVSAIDVKKLMQKAHVRLKFVLNEDNEFIGIISADDLTDQKLLIKVSEGLKREEILVTDLMRSKSNLMALDFNEIAKSTIGDVISTLKNSGQQHCLVIDHDTFKIRGIFSASDISRKLHLAINIQDRSSFYKVFSETV